MSGPAHHLLRSYAHFDSPIHRVSASVKLAATLLFVIAIALVPTREAAWTIVPLLVLVALTRAARVPFSAFAARLALAQPFVLAVAVLALFQGRGVEVFLAIALKSTAGVASVQLLAHTTPFEDVLASLRGARVPSALIAVLGLLHRYLFVLVEESDRMRRARMARTWRGGRWNSWQALASIVTVSFVRSLARVERISAAMRARGQS